MTTAKKTILISLLGGCLAAGALSLRVLNSPPADGLPDAVRNAVIEPDLVGVDPLPAMAMDWKCVLPESPLYAASRAEVLQSRYPPSAKTIDADRSPVRTIADNRATYSAVAVDPNRNEVVLQDENLFQILVYNREANTPPQASMTEPKRWIGGLNSKVEFNCGLYIDPGSGDIYSVPNDTVDTMVVFGRGAEGNVKPDRELRTPHGTYGITVDEEKQELFLTVQHDNAVVVFRKLAEGEEKPLREISGEQTALEDPHGIVLDPKLNLIFVANYGNARTEKPGSGTYQPPSISVYPRDAAGNVAPLRTIEGDKTRLNWPAGIALDPERGLVYVANDGGHSVLVFRVTDAGNVAPFHVIEGPKTNLKNPTGVAVDLKAGELWVSSFGNHAANVFSLDATGDVPPLRTIRAAPLGEQALGIGNPGAVGYDTKRNEILVPN